MFASVLDRFWLAQTLQQSGFKFLSGEAFFGLKIPLFFPISTFMLLGYLTIPMLRYLPLSYLYPLGHNQNKINNRFNFIYNRVNIIAGDWHYIRHNLPINMEEKILITSGINHGDFKSLHKRQASYLLVTTPFINNISPAANAMKATLVALGAKKEKYLNTARKLGWLPSLIFLGKQNDKVIIGTL